MDGRPRVRFSGPDNWLWLSFSVGIVIIVFETQVNLILIIE
jgi:hypothetical protein